MSTPRGETINIILAALGGEGGGVLTNWLIDVADSEGWISQSTSLAGVAQRTGATIYYLEIFPRSALQGDTPPVMSLFPAQGDIDIAIASEIAEAGRMIQRGFVTPERTALIASDHRVYGITEKEHLADGIVDAQVLQTIAARYAKDYIHYDMLALATEYGTVVSSVLLGAVAGAGVLPFSKDSYRSVITATGKAVAANLAAFDASYERARARGVEHFEPIGAAAVEPDVSTLPAATTAQGAQLLERLQVFPESCHPVLYAGLQKLVDYQDYAYAHQYLDTLAPILALDTGLEDHQLTRETGRYLALWMCFEDIPRVAQLKTRPERMGKVRSEVLADDDQLLHVTEFFRPRVEEMASLLPPALGRRVLASPGCRRFLGLFTGGKRLRTNTITVFVMLRTLAGMRRWRRSMLGFQHEHALIARWLRAVSSAGDTGDAQLALEVAECGRLVKGYGDTRARTTSQLGAILERLEADSGQVSHATLRRWREAALDDDEGKAFVSELAT
ncbi:indolepyruvate ferredoxin oxidoreductase [Kineobactrum sediminis]|uniref:Indolepyruvate ferredoxin oxidoreductase n=1 Tax=Kineobactrum sediminis TaxID=1905677 RepID=A0A2N5Y1X6_9GAMM|nr:indolepyruvate oxidoreductase subunit beta family protein [Kineobactrum sediminis]PLW82391.1 indolepyruvate ferredoxin oxidoreductase [Kineobactrum sediminis]